MSGKGIALKEKEIDIKPTVRVIGFPMDLGSGRRGVDMGPSALRIAGIENQLRDLGYDVVDEGDIPVGMPEVLSMTNPQLKYLPEITNACERLAYKVQSVLDKGDFPLVLGGDHSMSIGSIAGIAAHCRENNKRLGVIWIDAHTDVNLPETTPSGNIHGMPLAVSLGLGAPELISICGDFKKLQPQNLFIVGARSVDPGERKLIKELGIEVYTMTDIDQMGMFAVVTEILDEVCKNVDHLHISFDLDSVDPDVASGVGTPVPGGLSYREAHLIMEMLAESKRVCSLEVAEVNPILDDKNRSAIFAAGVVASTMGMRIL
ncbi:MAG TPA: arginase [Patescibacteria group bacterium]|nr:arginase [Patescibacteria group bacterium]